MSQLAHVCIDHATIYCKNAAEMDRLFSTLGFYSRNRIHYMLPNSYFELYQPHSENETYAFFRPDAGLHSFIFWSDDIDDCYRRVVNAGYVTAMPVSDFSRPANHGDPRGIASFRGFYLQTPLLPVGETAVVQQMNPELIYPQKPYPHPNTAIAMDKMFLCVPAGKEKEAADTLGAFCAVVSEGRPERNCIRELEVASPDELLEKYAVRIDPERSSCAGIRFRVQDLDMLRVFVSGSELPWREEDGVITVDLSEQVNLFMQFAAI